MKAIVKVDNDNLVVSLDDVASFAGINYKSVTDQVVKHESEFGELGLELNDEFGRLKRLSLNEYQASFLMTLLKNTKKVVRFKLELVKQFQSMRQQLVREQTKHNLVTFKDGTKSLRKWIKEYEEATGHTIVQKQFTKYLLQRGIISRTPISKTKLNLLDDTLGYDDQDGIRFNSSIANVMQAFLGK